MSTAGVRSNRGDSYQTLIAFDWALTILSNPEYEWIEILDTGISSHSPTFQIVTSKSEYIMSNII